MPTERQQAFLDLLEPVYPRLSRYALAIARNVEEAEDLTSETVLWALEEFDSVRDASRFVGFLFVLASRLYRRKKYRERFRIPFDSARMENYRDAAPLPDHAAEIRIVMEALQTLPERTKQTLLLFEVADLTILEIQKIQGGSLSGVKSRLKRGRAMLQRELGIEVQEPASNHAAEKQNLVTVLLSKTNDYAL